LFLQVEFLGETKFLLQPLVLAPIELALRQALETASAGPQGRRSRVHAVGVFDDKCAVFFFELFGELFDAVGVLSFFSFDFFSQCIVLLVEPKSLDVEFFALVCFRIVLLFEVLILGLDKFYFYCSMSAFSLMSSLFDCA
jgi:hypothetical protein